MNKYWLEKYIKNKTSWKLVLFLQFFIDIQKWGLLNFEEYFRWFRKLVFYQGIIYFKNFSNIIEVFSTSLLSLSTQ